MTVREYLEKKPMLFDGAMGTYLLEKYQDEGMTLCEQMNVVNSELVEEIHREYIRAGANAVKTNTFSANREYFPKKKELEQVIRAGYEAAKKAIMQEGKETFLFADIGPAEAEEKDAFLIYREVVDIFLGCGAQNFIFETLGQAEGIEKIAAYIKEKVPEGFVAVSFAISPEGYTRGGFLGKKLIRQMEEAVAVDALGFNCISGPKHLLEITKRMVEQGLKKYLCVMPNAGYPTMVGNRMYYGKTREYFGKSIVEMIAHGAAIVGGCCGTTPKEIKAVRMLLDSGEVPYGFQKDRKIQDVKEGVSEKDYSGKENEKNAFAQKLFRGEKVVVIELDPPAEAEYDFFMEGAVRYQKAGVDAIDIADCPIAKARIDSSILACKLARELAMTAIPHMTCRDRNMNATKALLLGLNMEGVNNVLTVTGDPVPSTMRGQIKTVFSYNSAVLARHIQSLNQEVFSENPFMVSGALNINAVNFDSQIRHAQKKIENGVSVLFTQPVLSERGFENLKRAKKELPVKILGGIMPVVSYRNANFMNNEMGGMDLEERLIALYQEKTREEGEELAYRISTAVIDAIEPYVDGYYLITPFKRVDLMLRIIKYAKGHR